MVASFIALTTMSGCGGSKNNTHTKTTPVIQTVTEETEENVILSSAMELHFGSADVPLSDQDSFSYTDSVSIDAKSSSLTYTEIMATGYTDNGEIFGGVKDANGELIVFSDGSPYICNGTNDVVGSGLDFSSILQKDGKLYLVSQFECSIGAMYMAELTQAPNGALSPKPGTLKYIDQSGEFGGWTHCAGSVTPWESHLGSEEYESDVKRIDDKGPDTYFNELKKYWGAAFAQITPYYYGWITETDIESGEAVYTKHYSMGRLSHEMAYVMPDKKTAYMTDDGSNVGFYMFVADSEEDLSSGTLYGAKFSQVEANRGGAFNLSWVNLGHASDSEIKAAIESKPKFSDIFDSAAPLCADTCPSGFTSINTSAGQECLKVKEGMEVVASRLETRRYSAIKGVTTELNKEEGIDYDPIHNKLYVAITSISKGMEDDDPANDFGGYNDIRLPGNACGGVYALDLAQDSELATAYAATTFNSILIGEAKDYKGTEYAGNSCDVNGISSPDNLTYLYNTNTLLIAEDTSGHRNNMVWAYDVETQSLTRIAAVPIGAEATSTAYYNDINDYSYISLVTQHPTALGESVLGVFSVSKDLTGDVKVNSFKEIAPVDYSQPASNDSAAKSSGCYTTGNGIVFGSNFDCGLIQPWQVYSAASNDDWRVASYNGKYYAYSSGYGADAPTDDWLISPKLTLIGDEILNFTTAKGYNGSEIVVKISSDYTGSGNPEDATWIDLPATIATTDDGNFVWTDSGDVNLSAFAGEAYIAFYHKASGTVSNTVANWEVDDVVITGSGSATIPFQSDFTVSNTTVLTGDYIEFKSSVSGGTSPYTFAWDMGNGTTKTDASFCYRYDNAGAYHITLTVSDKDANAAATSPKTVTVNAPLNESVPPNASDIRVATFNAYLNRATEGELHRDLLSGNDAQIKNVAHIVQYVKPDVLLLNEFDYNGTENVDLLLANYFNVAQGSDVSAIDYPYYYVSPSNTGIQSGLDYNNDGNINGDDAFGYGDFPGQYGMVVLSKYPIDTANIRTFQKFLWKDMPGAYLPTNADGTNYYANDVLNVYRLSSKSHWDIPVIVNGKVIHVLADHPTPPTFDDGDKDSNSDLVDWNGLRNHDEIRLWSDYVKGESYMYDDKSVSGGLAGDTRFVILGDHNADPDEGDSYDNAIMQLLDNTMINASVTPTSLGATSEGAKARENDDTANWNMRADYVLPSTYGFEIDNCRVFWPQLNDVKHYLVEKSASGGENSSDHRLVWCDMDITDTNASAVPAGGGESNTTSSSAASNLYFSEYIEGSSNNKALEIYNASENDVSLAEYKIVRYSNGGTSGADVALDAVTLEPNKTFAVVYSSAAAELLTYADQQSTDTNHNGDDAYELIYIPTGEVIDSIGKVGEDPGSEWIANGVSTKDQTLRRKTGVTQGDVNSADDFDPSIEWDTFDKDTFDGLGAR